MIIATSTNIYYDIGSVATMLFTDFAPYFFAIVGLILGFWFLEKLITYVAPNYHPRFRDDTENEWYDKQDSINAVKRLDRTYEKRMSKPFKWTTKE
jgi:hypothetical protein